MNGENFSSGNNAPVISKEVLGTLGASVSGGAPMSHWHIYAGVVLTLLVLAGGAYAIFYGDKWFENREQKVLALLQEHLIPLVVQLQCFDEEKDEPTGVGSGVYEKTEDGVPFVTTNAHVVLAPDGNFYGCYVYFPDENGIFYKSVYWAGLAETHFDREAVIDGTTLNGIDYAAVFITEPGTDEEGIAYPFPPTTESFGKQIASICESKDKASIKIGDKIYVFGYPGVGKESLTVTEGIVSGFLGNFSEWIKVSASINLGNSGGIAISAKNGCYIGIPTQLLSNDVGSVGQLLAVSFITQFIENETGNIADATKLEKLTLGEYKNPQFGLRFDHPLAWRLEETQENGELSVYLISPPENALDSFLDDLEVHVFDFGEPVTLDEYLDLDLRMQEDYAYDFEVLDKAPTHLPTQFGALPGYMSLTTGVQGDTQYAWLTTFAIRENVVYLFRLNTTYAGINRYAPIFYEILDSGSTTF